MDDAEKLSRPLGPGRAPSAADVQAQDLDPGLRAALLHDAAARAAAYLEGLDARGVQADAAAVAALQRLHEPLPSRGSEPAPMCWRCSTRWCRPPRWASRGNASSAS